MHFSEKYEKRVKNVRNELFKSSYSWKSKKCSKNFRVHFSKDTHIFFLFFTSINYVFNWKVKSLFRCSKLLGSYKTAYAGIRVSEWVSVCTSQERVIIVQFFFSFSKYSHLILKWKLCPVIIYDILWKR